jgi:hypothetical protein
MPVQPLEFLSELECGRKQIVFQDDGRTHSMPMHGVGLDERCAQDPIQRAAVDCRNGRKWHFFESIESSATFMKYLSRAAKPSVKRTSLLAK